MTAPFCKVKDELLTLLCSAGFGLLYAGLSTLRRWPRQTSASLALRSLALTHDATLLGIAGYAIASLIMPHKEEDFRQGANA
jgi:hypothetical protein